MDAARPITLALAAGLLATSATALADDRTPLYTSETVYAHTVGHIYYNFVTGEKIATALSDNIRPVDSQSNVEVWAADNSLPCADFNQIGEATLLVDTPNGEMDQPVRERYTILDWADIEADTVIDCVQLSYFTGVQDADTNSDGIGDGVQGFAAQWSFYDADNGFDGNYRTGLIAFTITDLPGRTGTPDSVVGYDLTIDLASSFASSLAFEIGDTDSDMQSAAIHNPLINTDTNSDGFGDADLDEDGFADWTFGIQFTQPGTRDTDNADADDNPLTGIDGDPANKGITALGLAHYRGQTIETDNGDGTFSYEVIPDAGVNATGAEDGYDIFDNTGFHTGTYWMGGFTCNDPSDGTMNAFGQISMIMYSPLTALVSGCNSADFAKPYYQFDIFDVLGFISAFNAANPCADFTDDGVLDIFDVLGFIDAFNAGCP